MCTDLAAPIVLPVFPCESVVRIFNRDAPTSAICPLNRDLTVDFQKARYSDEYFQLYKTYLGARHPDGGMDDPDPEDFERFLLNPLGRNAVCRGTPGNPNNRGSGD